ncbi:MAG: PKD domain-containing protein [Terracidiphilus sp.]
MSSMRATVLSFVGAVLISLPLLAQTSVKLNGSTSPTSGQAGLTTVTVTGSGFPSGTISPASVTVTLTPKSGGTAVTTTATSVTPGTGTTSTIGFLIPSSISVTSATVYEVSIAGQTTGGATFQSSNSAALTIDPPSSISSLSPKNGLQGQTVSVTITGKYTNFVNGVTQANFGPNISVGGAAPGTNGLVGVVSATSATATLVINNNATVGSQDVTVVTGAQTATLAGGFTVEEASVTLGSSATPSTAQAGITTASVTGSGFPAGTIWAANVTVSLTPKSGGTAVTTTATSVTAGTSGTNTIAFLVPASISVSTPTVYEISISGATTTGIPFQSSKSSTITVDPPSYVSSLSPNNGLQGATLTVTITGKYTNFVNGVSVATFGPDISIGGASTGTPGPITVVSATSATASISISDTAALGSSNVTVVTGNETDSLANGFTVNEATVKLSAASPGSAEPGITTVSVTGTGFPAMLIQPSSVTVTLTPKSGGTAVNTLATSVTAGTTGGSDTITFLAPASISVSATTTYEISISGVDETGSQFQSSNTVGLTIDPPSYISSLSPSKGLQGQSLTVTITGKYSTFISGVSEAAFCPGISVGGGAAGGLGPVTVTSATKATASIFISNTAPTGSCNVTMVTGPETDSITNGFVVDVDSTPPVAVPGGPYSAKLPPGTVQFNGSTSYDPKNKNAVLTFNWNFGDGSANGTGATPTHTYTAPGTYNGTLIVTNSTGVSSLPTAFVVTITATVPTAVPGGPYSVQLPAAVQFNGSGSSDPNTGATLTFNWNFGDGTANGIGATPTHTYATAGTYNGTLTVSDNLGLTSAPAPFVVNVAAAPPLPQIAITNPQPLTIFGATSANPITVTGTIDNSTDIISVNGMPATVSGGSWSAPGVILREGQDVITATATDVHGDVGTASVTVTLNTTPPQLGILAPTSGQIVTSSTITVAGNVNEQVPGTINSKQITVTVNGIAATVSNRTFSAANVPLVQGMNTITVTATDPAGNTSQSQVTVNYMGTIPVQKILAVSGEGQTAPIGTMLPQPLVIQVVNTNGAPVPSQQVTFSVVKSDGALTSSNQQGQQLTAVTDQNGQASVQFQLGSRVGVGNNQVSVTAAGYTGQALFCETSTVGPPSQIVVEMGDGQTGVVGQPLPSPLELEVLDSGGNPVAYVPVTFTVQSGGGTLNGNSTLQVSTDINGMANALLTLGQQEGTNNNVVSATFAGNSGPASSFVASSQAAGPPQITSISGLVEDDSNTPIPGATITLEGTSYSAVSDTNGNFSISPAPIGTFLMQVVGQTSTRTDATFPTLVYNITTIAGINNTLGMPICLPPLDPTSVQTYSPTSTQPLVLQMTGVPGYLFTVAPGSVTNANGTPYSGPLSLSQVHADRVPMAPPHGTLPLMAGTLQPPGLHFNPPVQTQFPNTSGLAPGTVLDLYSYDHDQMAWVSQGPVRVSADGSVLVSDPGFGISKSGWHFPPPPPPPPMCASACTTANPCMTSQCVNGACMDSPANDGGMCSDGTANQQCGTNGVCQGGNCTFDSTATNGQSCTPSNVCIVNATCQNGTCTGTPYDTNSTYASQQSFSLPPELTQAASQFVDTFSSGVGELEPINLQYQTQAQNCCTQDSGPISLGKVSSQGTVQLAVNIAGLPVWPGSFKIQFTLTIPLIGEVELNVQEGVFFGGEISVNGTIGYVANQCEEMDNCAYGQINLAIEPSLYAITQQSACVEIYGLGKVCQSAGIKGGVKIALNGGIRENTPDQCTNQVQGFGSIERPTVYLTGSIDSYSISFQWQPPISLIPGWTCAWPAGPSGQICMANPF